MGIFSGLKDFVDPTTTTGGLSSGGLFGGAIGGLTENFGGITDFLGFTNHAGEDALKDATEAQIQATREGIEFQKERDKRLEELLRPYTEMGARTVPDLENQARTGEIAPESLQPYAFLGTALSNQMYGDLQNQYKGIKQPESLYQNVLDTNKSNVDEYGNVRQGISNITGEYNQDILKSPFYQALQKDLTERISQSQAARGKLNSGGTTAILGKALLEQGTNLAQQDLQNRMSAQGQRYGQLSDALGLGINVRQTGLQNLSTEQQRQLSNQLQMLGQNENLYGIGQDTLSNNIGLLSSTGQQDFANKLALNEQRYARLRDLAGLGQNSAAGVGAAGVQSAAGIANMLQDIGNAQASRYAVRDNMRQGNNAAILNTFAPYFKEGQQRPLTGEVMTALQMFGA